MRFKISLQTLAFVLRELKISPRPTKEAHEKKKRPPQWNKKIIPEDVKDKIVRLRKKGTTMKEIARQVGFTRNVVQNFLRERLRRA